MPAEATVRTEPRPDSTPALDFSRIREEVLRAYQPATPEESLLAHQIARAWFRLQNYYEMEARIMEKQNLAEMFETDLARFKALNSAIAAAERMWRQAILEFQRARRRAAPKASPASPHETIRGASASPAPPAQRRPNARSAIPFPAHAGSPLGMEPTAGAGSHTSSSDRQPAAPPTKDGDPSASRVQS
jgi:hypothetical protein